MSNKFTIHILAKRFWFKYFRVIYFRCLWAKSQSYNFYKLNPVIQSYLFITLYNYYYSIFLTQLASFTKNLINNEFVE